MHWIGAQFCVCMFLDSRDKSLNMFQKDGARYFLLICFKLIHFFSVYIFSQYIRKTQELTIVLSGPAFKKKCFCVSKGLHQNLKSLAKPSESSKPTTKSRRPKNKRDVHIPEHYEAKLCTELVHSFASVCSWIPETSL